MATALAMTRRAALTQALLLVGASGSLATLAACEASLLPGAKRGGFFAAAEMALLADLCDQLLPETDTPGAVTAGVPAFVDAMMSSWAGAKSRLSIGRALERLDSAAGRMFGHAYAALAAAQRRAVVGSIDRLSFTAAADAAARDYRMLKTLIFLGYTTSPAANPLYLANPGEYRGDLSRSQYDALVRANV